MASPLHNSTAQNYDRKDEGDYLIDMATLRPNSFGDGPNGPGNDGFDITASQKMMSAVTGSLFTSLLGEYKLLI